MKSWLDEVSVAIRRCGAVAMVLRTAALMALMGLMALAACGQKGPLTLPAAASAPAATASSPAGAGR
jgi:predicted small lipoprotein YifL